MKSANEFAQTELCAAPKKKYYAELAIVSDEVNLGNI